jgi:YqaJ-like viral recombinase domain
VQSKDIEIFDCPQNSPEWSMARIGIPTASAFSDILAKGEGRSRRTYMLKLAGEIITGTPQEGFSNVYTERGHAMELEVRDLYQFQTGADLRRVGFVRRGRAGCSPDSLIGDDGGLEIKTMLPHLLIPIIQKDAFPSQHVAQVQGTLWITGRQWWEIAIYWPGLPLFTQRAYRDEAFIQRLATEVAKFNSELDDVVSQVRQYKAPGRAA